MKNTTKTIALLLAVLAVGNSAQAQRQELQANKPYFLSGAPAESAASNISYQWYRDGQPIAGATSPDYILPAHLAYGTNVEFKRGAVSSICPGNIIFTNVVNASFGMVVGAVSWASVNVDSYQTFAARPDMLTRFYQWNRPTAWAATGDVSNWSSAAITDAAWLINPCPAGWRLPTQAEFVALNNTSSTWANALTRGNNVSGRFYGLNSQTCTLPNNMYSCLFLPAGGMRHGDVGGILVNQDSGDYWSATQSNTNDGRLLGFNNESSIVSSCLKTYGASLRCVQDVAQ